MKVIVLYKLVRGGVELLFAFILFRLVSSGGREGNLTLAARISRHHVLSALSMAAATRLLQAKPSRLYVTDLALVLDATTAFAEGVSLAKGYAWAPWFVVWATGLPLPLEIFALVRKPHAGRILFFCANTLILAYLIRRLRKTAGSGPAPRTRRPV
jgi:uncharacterized membrane protein (DUF2068 family)